jgi:hypothetical protein
MRERDHLIIGCACNTVMTWSRAVPDRLGRAPLGARAAELIAMMFRRMWRQDSASLGEATVTPLTSCRACWRK